MARIVNAAAAQMGPIAKSETRKDTVSQTIFHFAKHREPESYRLIVERKGAKPPPEA